MAAGLSFTEARWPAVHAAYLHVQQANLRGALLFPQWAVIHLMLTDCFWNCSGVYYPFYFEKAPSCQDQKNVLQWRTGDPSCKARPTSRAPLQLWMGFWQSEKVQDCIIGGGWGGGSWRKTGCEGDWLDVRRRVWPHGYSFIVSQVKLTFIQTKVPFSLKRSCDCGKGKAAPVSGLQT